MKNILLMTVAAFAVAELSAAVPEVEVTEVGQNEQRVVTVGYTLSAPAVVTVDFLTNGVSLMTFESRPSGDVGWVATSGSKTITWRPRKSLPSGLELKDVTVRVEAYSPARQPDYMVVDPATGWQRFYATSNDVPGGVLANEDYRGKYLLLRRISAAWKEVVLGKPHPNWSGYSSRRVRHAVMLTNDFYMTVFPVTRGQLAQAYGWTGPTDDPYTGQGDKTTHWRLRPAEGMGYDDIRGGEADDEIDWPTTGDRVATGSILGKFRGNTGLLFDLPTDAQYEIACRGGIENADFYCGGFDWRDATAATLAGRIGWYKDNWADDPLKPAGATSANFTHVVGQKEPNPYGLYDLCGNVRSLCRDWWMDQPGTAKDGYEPQYYEPTGPTKAQAELVGGIYRRVSHSCTYSEGLDLMQTASRNPETPGKKGKDAGAGAPYIGFRMVCPALYGGTILE